MKYGRRSLALAGYVALMLAGLVCGWFAWQFWGMFNATRPVTWTGAYARVLAKWKEDAADIVGHFPEAIPADATDVDFYFYPGMLQADSRLELRFRTGPERIDAYYEAFSPQATKITRGAVLVHYREDRGDLDIIELGEDYVVMQFDADADNLPEHSKEHGVIISRQKQEIIFWAEW